VAAQTDAVGDVGAPRGTGCEHGRTFAVAFLAVRRRSNALARLGLTLFLAGGASNWIDRIVRGSVVDFLNVGIGPVRTVIFNVADVAIMLGACIFVFAEFPRNTFTL
jgi:lipoprotein signal peptidase